MVRPTLLQPKDVAVGDLVQARDGTHWYNAKVIAKTGRGASIAAVVRFIGFSESHNAKFTAAMQGMRKRLSRAYLQQERMEALWGNDGYGCFQFRRECAVFLLRITQSEVYERFDVEKSRLYGRYYT